MIRGGITMSMYSKYEVTSNNPERSFSKKWPVYRMSHTSTCTNIEFFSVTCCTLFFFSNETPDKQTHFSFFFSNKRPLLLLPVYLYNVYNQFIQSSGITEGTFG